MRIDAHQHFWRFNLAEFGWIDDSMAVLRRDFLPNDLKPELDRIGFDGSINIQARQSLEETRFLLDLAKSAPFVLGVVGWVDLRSPKVREQLKEFAGNPKFVGVRHVVQYEPDDRFLMQPDFLRGIAALEEFDLAYDILIFPKHLRVAAEFVERFPRQRFVLDHLAKPFIKAGRVHPWDSDLGELAKFPNVFCKLSGMVAEADIKNWKPENLTPYIDIAFQCFGSERLMIGSDWPVCTAAGSYSQVMHVVLDYLSKHPAKVQDAVLGGNAARFWKLKT